MRSFALVVALVGSPSLAATVEAVAKDGRTVTLKVTPEEAKTLKTGDKVKVDLGTGAPVTATVATVKGTKATLTLATPAPKTAAVKKGASATFASAGPLSPMTVAPPAPSAVETPAASTDSYASAMTSSGFVSPAQLHQIDGRRTDGELGFATANAKMSGGGFTAQINGAGPILQAAAATTLANRKTRLAFFLEHQALAGRVKADDFNQKYEQTQTTLMPAFSYDWSSHVSAGVAYKIVQSRYSGEFYSPAHNIAYAQPIPGVLWRDAAYEAGMTFTPRVREESSVTEGNTRTTITRAEGSVVTVHGAGRLDGTSRLFGHVDFNQNRQNNVDGETSWKNNADVLFGMARALDSFTTVDGAVTVYLPAASGATEKTPDNILRLGLQMGMEKKATDTLRVGAGLEYEQASDDYKEDGTTVKVSQDRLAISARGILRL